MITLQDYLMGRDVKDPLTVTQMRSAIDIVIKLGELEESYATPLVLTSGYRPVSINSHIPGAVHGDAHERCCGVDLHDPDHRLSDWCLSHINELERIGFWMESPQSAKNHVHLQTYAPKSGRRVFIA